MKQKEKLTARLDTRQKPSTVRDLEKYLEANPMFSKSRVVEIALRAFIISKSLPTGTRRTK